MVTYSIVVVQVFQSAVLQCNYAVQFAKQMSELSEISSKDFKQPLLQNWGFSGFSDICKEQSSKIAFLSISAI